jgi:hypothetical protein
LGPQLRRLTETLGASRLPRALSQGTPATSLRSVFACLALALVVAGCKADPETKPAPQPKAATMRPPVVARIQAGRFKVGANEANENVLAKDVTFPEPFHAVPIVVATPVHFDDHPDVVSVTVSNTTASGFRLLIHRSDHPVKGWGLVLNVDWIAVDHGGGVAKVLGEP